jgi:hypothetical protein
MKNCTQVKCLVIYKIKNNCTEKMIRYTIDLNEALVGRSLDREPTAIWFPFFNKIRNPIKLPFDVPSPSDIS